MIKKVLCLMMLATALSSFHLLADNHDEDRKPGSDANITGHVQNARTKEHLPGIHIIIKGTTIGAATDLTGHYFLKNLPTGEYTIEASSLGYTREEKTVTLESGKTIELNFLLEEESIDMDGVVVSSTKNETNKREAATIVNVVSLKTFESTASTNLAETMNFQPGVRVENNCGNCGVTQLRINGLEGQYSQILLDSRPIFSSLAAVYGLEQLPVSMIERVELVRGGGSALFGSSAIGGVVNIITRDPLRSTLSVSNTTNVFGDGKSDINTSLSGALVSDDHKAGIYLFGMMKNRDWYDRNGDGFSEVPKITSETMGFRGYYRTGLYSRITAEYHHIHEFRRGGNKFDGPPHDADITEQIDHNIDGGGVRFDMNSADMKHRLGIYASAQRIARESYYGAGQSHDAYGRTFDNTVVAGGQYTYAFDKLLFMPSELTGGVEWSYNDLDDHIVRLSRVLRQNTHIVGGFLQNEWKNKKFSLLIGARLDKHNLMDDVVFSPRANVRYSPNDNIGLRLSYSSGYRAPQAYNEDLHVEAVSDKLKIIKLSKGLKPEYSHSFSGSVDLYHTFGRVQTNLLVEGFYTRLNNVFFLERMDEEGAETSDIVYYTRRNGAGAIVQGINLEAKVGMAGVFEVQAGFTIQRSRYTEPENWSDQLTPQKTMFRSPDTYGYFIANANITQAFKASLFGNYTGPMLVQHTFNDADSETVTPRFFDAGAKLSYDFRLSPSTELQLNCGVKNIFDSYQRDIDYGAGKDAAYVYGPMFPRMFFVGAKFSM